MSAFSAGNFSMFIFFAFWLFMSFNLQESFCLNIYYRNILLHFGWKWIKNKIKKMFFFPYPPLTNLQ